MASYDSYGSCTVCEGDALVETKVICPNCKGRGQVFCTATHTFNYSWFGGGGSETVTCKRGMFYNPRGDWGDETCYYCNGSSYHDCYTCEGYGEVKGEEECTNCDNGTVKESIKATIANAYWGLGR